MRRRDFIAGLGSTAAWPMVAPAQQPAGPVIGFLDGGRGNENEAPHLTTAFHQGLFEQGYVAGRNVEILYRWAGGRPDLLPALAADLVRRPVSVIFAVAGSATALAAKSATATIPIVFATPADPIEVGLVASLNRPGGNVTGVSFLAESLVARRLETLRELKPGAALIAYLVNPASPQVESRIKEAGIAASKLRVRLVILNASTPSEIEAAFAHLASQQIDALLADADPLFFVQRNQIVALAAGHGVAAIYQVREMVDAGGLISYGANLTDVFRLAGNYVGRILKGEKPTELPVQQSTRFETILNLKAAKALGLEVPAVTLLRADEVIE